MTRLATFILGSVVLSVFAVTGNAASEPALISIQTANSQFEDCTWERGRDGAPRFDCSQEGDSADS